MERDQRFQQQAAEDETWIESSQPPLDSPTLSDEPWVEHTKPNAIDPLGWVRLLWQHPLVFWSGIWVLLLLITGIAVTSLMSPELSKQINSSDGDNPQPSVAGDASTRTMPMWALGTITLSCIAGSVLISQRFKQVRQEARSLQSKTAIEPLPLLDSPEDAASLLQPLSAPAPPMSAVSAIQVVAPTPSLSKPEQPVVTVVPPDESTPLDWEDAGLAEIMDIRYRRHR